MLVACPNLELPVHHLLRLANTTFDPRAFRLACETFARFDEAESDADLWHFTLTNGEFRPRSVVGSPSQSPIYFVEGSEAKLAVSLKSEVVARRPGGSPVLRLLGVQVAILSICWWESFDESEHEIIETWRLEREEFARVYEETLAKSIHTIGPPRMSGRDDDENGHRYAVWRGNTGLLILQQSCFDPQFGLDINFWLQPWSGDDPHPYSPFIDWLTNMTRARS